MRAWFMGKMAREKILLVLLLATAALLWSSDLSERLRDMIEDVRLTSGRLEVQSRWLRDRERIEGEARAAVANLDSSRTFNSVRLSGEISTLAQQAGIGTTYRSSAGQTQQTAQFSVHSLEVRLTRVPWDNLLQFYDALSQRAPYISIETFQLSSVQSDTNLLNAQLSVSSVEISAR